MVEYGHGVGEGTGAVGGVRGGPSGGSDDWGAAMVGIAQDAVDTVVRLPAEQLLILGAVLVVGLILLKRAF